MTEELQEQQPGAGHPGNRMLHPYAPTGAMSDDDDIDVIELT